MHELYDTLVYDDLLIFNRFDIKNAFTSAEMSKIACIIK